MVIGMMIVVAIKIIILTFGSIVMFGNIVWNPALCLGGYKGTNAFGDDG